MAWTTPKTWTTGETLTASDFNTHIQDNLNALKDPPSANYDVNEASNYTIASGTFADVDATDLALAITTNGGDVMVGFHGYVSATGGAPNVVHFDVHESSGGARLGGDDGMIAIATTGDAAFTRLITGLSAGAHTFKLQWKTNTSSSTATLFAGAGTSNYDLHPQFWVREVS